MINKNIKKVGIFAALAAGAYLLFSSFAKSTGTKLTFGNEVLYPASTNLRVGTTKVETQSYSRQTKEKSALVPKTKIVNVLGTISSSEGQYLITSLGYIKAADVVVRVVIRDSSVQDVRQNNNTAISD